MDANKYLEYMIIILILGLNILCINQSLDYIRNNQSAEYRDKDLCINVINVAKDNLKNNIVIYDDTAFSEVARVYDTSVIIHTYNSKDGILKDYDLENYSDNTTEILNDCIFVIEDAYDINDLFFINKDNCSYLTTIGNYLIYKLEGDK